MAQISFAAFEQSLEDIPGLEISVTKARLKSRQRFDQQYLFPGYGLKAKPGSSNYCAVVIGDLFESISESFLGARRLTVDSGSYICPDLEDSVAEAFIESKATQKRHYFKVTIGQLHRYLSLVAPGEDFASYKVRYHLWTYNTQHLSKNFATMGDMIRSVTNTVLSLTILDISILKALHDVTVVSNQVSELDEAYHTIPTTPVPNCHVRKYASWKGYQGSDGYHVLQIGHTFLQKLREEPHQVLLKTLFLEPQNYDCHSTECANAIAMFQGVDFPVNKFQVFSAIKRKPFVKEDKQILELVVP